MFSITLRDERHLKTLYKPFAHQVRKWLNRCHEEKLPVHLTQSFRFYGEQDILWQNGNSRARGGESLHNFYLAIDFAFDNSSDQGLQDPYKEPFNGAWEKAAKLAEEFGMEAGYFWENQDKPHVQAKIKTPVKDLHKLYIKKDSEGLFSYLDEYENLV